MKVVILCGGLGMRLREETEYKPKPMVNIGNRPILWHIMKTYAHFGYNEFVLCLGYKGDFIKNYFLNYEAMSNDVRVRLGKDRHIEIMSNSSEDFDIILAETGLNTMTGARVKKIQKYIKEDDFMLTYGDGVARIDIDSLVKFHREHGKIGTVTGVSPVSRFGELILDGDAVTEFTEKPLRCETFVNGGFLVFKKEFFDYFRDDDALILEKEPLPNLARDKQLMVYKHCDFWFCMDTARDKEYLDKMWNSNKAYWKVWED